MTAIIERTYTKIPCEDVPSQSQTLEDFRENSAYVLLGAPGAGKTEAFKQAAEATGSYYVTARNFLTLDSCQTWHGKTLFIDGLDEVRASSTDKRTPFDKIRAKLDKFGKPKFRLSCREADWLGANDRDHLKSVSRDGQVVVVQIDPLTDDNIRAILADQFDSVNADKIIQTAQDTGIGELLKNPQNLKMLGLALQSNDLDGPTTRREIFDLACQTLVQEHNFEHQLANSSTENIPAFMDVAGQLCAFQLLTGCGAFTRSNRAIKQDFLAVNQISQGDPNLFNRVLKTKLFETSSDGKTTPTHRHIAEFLAGKYLHKRIQEGLPVGRILSLITGYDGGIVSEFRGLSAWLAAWNPSSRYEIISRDPLCTALYGDTSNFSTQERASILTGFRYLATRECQFFSTIREATQLGELAGPDTVEVFKEALTKTTSERGQQLYVRFKEKRSQFIEKDVPYDQFSPESQAKKKKSQQVWKNKVEANQSAFSNNRCPPSLLNGLAQAYLAHSFTGESRKPIDRLGDLLGGNEWIDTIIESFREAIRRNDTPTEDDILRLRRQNQVHHLELPILAGLHDGAVDALFQNEPEKRLALAIHYTTPVWHRNAPPSKWTQSLLESCPEVFADVLVQCTQLNLESRVDFRNDFAFLEHSKDKATMTRLTSLPILEGLPSRCSEEQLFGIKLLLHSALIHLEEAELQELIRHKLWNKSMNVGQRVYWLTSGFFIKPKIYQEKFESYITKNEIRLRHLVNFMEGSKLSKKLLDGLDSERLSLLIQLIGSTTSPSQNSFIVNDMIAQLSSNSTCESTRSFGELMADDQLHSWQPYLADGAYVQRVCRREAEFHHSTLQQINKVLNNGPPTNAADLKALIFDHLKAISQEIHHTSSSDWKTFWNVDQYNRPEKPKPENACRDVFEHHLKIRLQQFEVTIQSEAQCASGTRADISVSIGDINVPIEIKNSCNRELWTSMKSQLINKYARSTGADGHGIFLVFWFGDHEHGRPKAGGGKPPPKSADELEGRLRDRLSVNEQRKVSVSVMDVSKPSQ